MVRPVSPEYAKISVSIPVGMSERASERVGPRGLSRDVAEALASQERRSALLGWLADQDGEHGATAKDLVEAVRHQWLAVGRD